ncbi:MAG: hypothetical protein KC475_11030 [Cyanobacteria bacterium HKST-UBA03]|nr:hypothetical protein [Cyanobacteria bacterium HKST-UBA03]
MFLSKPAFNPRCDTVQFASLPPLADRLVQAAAIPYRFSVFDTLNDRQLPMITSLETLPHVQPASRVVVGDMHGNWLKLLETLLVGGLITFQTPGGSSDALKPLTTIRDLGEQLNRAIDADPNLEQRAVRDSIWELKDKLLEQFQTIRWTDENRQLLLLGDVIADRGPLDYVTMGLIRAINRTDDDGSVDDHTNYKDRIAYLTGNHDHGVYQYYTFGESPLLGEANHQENRYRSLVNSLKLMQDDPGRWDDLKKQYQQFLGHAKVMLYNPDEKTLYVHAPVRRQEMNGLVDMVCNYAQTFNFTRWKYNEIIHNVAMNQFVDDANELYHFHINYGFEHPQAELVLEDENLKAADQVFQDFFWVRTFADSQAFLPFYEPSISRQLVCRLVHGHTNDTVMSQYSNLRPGRGQGDLGGSVDPNFAIYSLNNAVRYEWGQTEFDTPSVLFLEKKEGNRLEAFEQRYQPQNPTGEPTGDTQEDAKSPGAGRPRANKPVGVP